MRRPIAVVGEVPIERLWHAVPAYPDDQRGLAAAAGDLPGLTGAAAASGRPPAAPAQEPPDVTSASRRPTRRCWRGRRPLPDVRVRHPRATTACRSPGRRPPLRTRTARSSSRRRSRCRRKAYNIRRDGRVALLFSEPTGERPRRRPAGARPGRVPAVPDEIVTDVSGRGGVLAAAARAPAVQHDVLAPNGSPGGSSTGTTCGCMITVTPTAWATRPPLPAGPGARFPAPWTGVPGRALAAAAPPIPARSSPPVPTTGRRCLRRVRVTGLGRGGAGCGLERPAGRASCGKARPASWRTGTTSSCGRCAASAWSAS